MTKVLPPKQGASHGDKLYMNSFDDVYGFRGEHPDVKFLNPWEFLMWWECVPLPRPSRQSICVKALSLWTAAGEAKIRGDGEAVPGEDYVCNDTCSIIGVVFFLDIDALTHFRHRWYLRRRQRPMVPSPTGTPMPDRQNTQEGSRKLFSLYMRP